MLFIFDWDGTLSDSATKIIDSMQDAMVRVGLPVQSDGAIRNIIGLGLPEAICTLYPGIDDVSLNALRDAYSAAFLDHAEALSPFFPGAEEAIESLLSRGEMLAVATGKSRKGLDRVLRDSGWSPYFHFSRCADETASKPHPMMLRELLIEAQVDVSDAVMVGDTEFDMAMALEIEMPRIAVSYGAHSPARLLPYSPLLCTDNLRDVPLFYFDK